MIYQIETIFDDIYIHQIIKKWSLTGRISIVFQRVVELVKLSQVSRPGTSLEAGRLLD